MGIRIKDIARIAEVSPATVSLVLNDKPGVGNETRERIWSIARDLGHQRQKKKQQVRGDSLCFLHIARHGHAVNRDHDVFIADYIEGLTEASKRLGFSLEILTFKTVPIEKIIEMAQGLDAKGIIVLGTELSASDVEAFSTVSKPLVFIDTYHEFLKFDFVDMNNEDSVFTLVSYLHERGHRRIGIVTGSIETRNFKLRDEGFTASLARFALRRDRRYDFSVDSTFHGAFDDMKAILSGKPTLPTALFCANDIIACACIKAFREAGIRVPEDLSLVGFDDLPLSAVAEPPLTTIQVSKAQIGRMAIQLLVTRIKSEAESPPVKVLIGGAMVERQSVGEIPVEDSEGGVA